MPPKKKKGKKKKKKGGDGELTIDDKYKKTLDDIEALKDHLAIRKEVTRRARAQEDEWKQKMVATERKLDQKDETHKAVSADMTRQYKTMQTELGYRVSVLEDEVAKTRKQLETTEIELKRTTEEKERVEREKDEEITILRQKLAKMESHFDRVFNDALDALMDKITAAKPDWADRSTYIQSKNKQTLLEFGLNPLDL